MWDLKTGAPTILLQPLRTCLLCTAPETAVCAAPFSKSIPGTNYSLVLVSVVSDGQEID